MTTVTMVVNDRFIPTSRDAGFIYGVVQHVFGTADRLAALGLQVQYLTYRRDPSAPVPRIESRPVVDGLPAFRLVFDWSHPRAVVMAVIEDWAAHQRHGERRIGVPTFYVQSDAVLEFFAGVWPVVITHHAPFVDDVSRRLSEKAAKDSFDWDHPKADFLAVRQQQAVEILRDQAVVCLEISALQEDYLLARGIPPHRILRLPPPIQLGATQAQAGLVGPVRRLVTAVSRFDGFKGADLIVDAAVCILATSSVASIELVGGGQDDPVRDELIRRLSPAARAVTSLVPRISHSELINRTGVGTRSLFVRRGSIWFPIRFLKRWQRGFRPSFPGPGTLVRASTCQASTTSTATSAA